MISLESTKTVMNAPNVPAKTSKAHQQQGIHTLTHHKHEQTTENTQKNPEKHRNNSKHG
jgi:hypothetical protein